MPTGTEWFRDSYRFENGFRRTTLARIELATLRSYDLTGNVFPEVVNSYRNIEIRDIDMLITSCKAFLQADGFWEEFAFCFDSICHFARLYFCLFRERQKSVPDLPDGWDPDLFDDAARRRNNARRRREARDSEPSLFSTWDDYHANFRQDGGDSASGQANQSPNEVEPSVVSAPSTVVIKRVMKPVHGVFLIDPKEVISFRYDSERHMVDTSLFLEDNIVVAHKDAPIHRTIRKMRKRRVPNQIQSWSDFMDEEDPEREEVKSSSVVFSEMDVENVDNTMNEPIDQLGSEIFGSDYRERFIPSDIDLYPHMFPVKPPQQPQSGPGNSQKFATSNNDVSRDAAQEARVPDYSTHPGRPSVFPPRRNPTCDVAVITKRSDRSSFSKKKMKQSSYWRSAKYLERSRSFSWLRRFRAQNVFKYNS